MQRLAATLLISTLAATAANAHAVITPREAQADSYARLALSITHGCDGSPTKVVRVRIPDGVNGARPQPKAGWTLDIKKEKLAQPIAGPHGATITERVTEIIWTGALDADHFDDFSINVRLPDAPNKTLHFATLQECASGKMDWSEIPASGKSAHELRYPAPSLNLLPKKPTHAH